MTSGAEEATAWSFEESRGFDHAKAVFDNNCQQFRHLNEQMNRIPPFAVTLTGGFWLLAVGLGRQVGLDDGLEQLARFSLMIFSGVCDFALVVVAIRIRDVMADYQASIDRFTGEAWTASPTRGNQRFRPYSMISTYSTLMIAGGFLSWIAAFALFPPTKLMATWQIVAAVALVVSAIAVVARVAPRWLSR